MIPNRPGLEPKCMTDNKTVKKNIKLARRYQRVTWGVLDKNPVAVVGGGPSAIEALEVLRNWPGDIIGVNDTAGFLSDNGIPCYLYSVDSTEVLFKIGPNVKGALFATRVDREQFKQFKRSEVRCFDMYEDRPEGGDVEGGPTSVCRTPHLLLRMGYRGIYFFGCDGSFYNLTHVSGKSEAAFENMMVIRAGGIDYITNAAFVLQCNYLVDVIQKHPQFIRNASGGLLKAMLDYPDTWEVIAIREDLRAQYAAMGQDYWTNEYNLNDHPIWKPGHNTGAETWQPMQATS
jgi:hypothetical protein